MGIFSFLYKQTPKTVIIEDEVFGRLERIPYGKNNIAFYFQNNNLLFAPTNSRIDCEIMCPGEIEPSSPNPAQRAFFRQLEGKYSTIVERVIPIFKKELKDWKPAFHFQDFEAEFKLIYLLIADVNTTQAQWELTFEVVSAGMYTVRIAVLGDEPQPGVEISY